jgi:hypothetical protein
MNNTPENQGRQPDEAQVALSEEGFVEAERATVEARAWLNEAMERRCRA